MKKTLSRIVFLLFLLPLTAASAFSQGFADEDDDEDSTAVVAPREDLSKYNEAEIKVNGKLFTLQDEMTFPKDDTVDISVRHLQPRTYVSVHIMKGGVVFKKTGYWSNELGELDLQVLTGSKVKGDAEISYFAGSGKKVYVKAKIIVE